VAHRAQPADKHLVSVHELIQREEMLNRFRRLMTELSRGTLNRNTFQDWEIAILLDLEALEVDTRRRAEMLRQYARAVERQLDTGPGPPLRFSEFLRGKSTRRPAIE
jgi:hypothetical protein